MKTLDEVIKAFEECIVPKNVFCNGCYKDDRCKITEDALNYLKQYQLDKQIFAYDIAKRSLELSERNDPLSWDELKGMEGKPVWLECVAKRWIVIADFRENENGAEYFEATDGGLFSANTQGDLWQAYRKERE